MDTLLGMYHAIRTVHGCYIAKVKHINLSKKFIEQVPSKQKPLTRKEGLLVALWCTMPPITAPTTRRSKTPVGFFKQRTNKTHQWLRRLAIISMLESMAWEVGPLKMGGSGKRRFLSHRINRTGIFTYIWLILKVNVGKHTIHRFCGYWKPPFLEGELLVLGRVYVQG